MAEVRMPKMSDGMEEGTVLRWLKREGEQVVINEPIAEIETDKANVEMPAEESGTISRIVVTEGQTVPVGAVLAHIGEVSASAGSGSPPSTDSISSGGPGNAPPNGFGKAPAEETPQSTPSAGPAAERLKASPLARKLAKDLGIDLAQIQGSGPGGRIVERDLKAFRQGGRSQRMPSMPEPAAPRAAPAAPAVSGRDEEISKMRRAIAKRTVQSKQTVPHIYLLCRALSLLDELNGPSPENKVTINDLIIKASAVALAKFPDVNVSFTPDEKIRRYDAINIGVAVGTEQGLFMPIIPDCGKKTLRQISLEAKALADKARNGTITPQEMSGGTFSISNLGMFGIEEFGAVINPPESAILAVGAALREAIVTDDGNLKAGRRMRVTLSCDHRSVDGLLGARLLQELARLLENPLELLA